MVCVSIEAQGLGQLMDHGGIDQRACVLHLSCQSSTLLIQLRALEDEEAAQEHQVFNLLSRQIQNILQQEDVVKQQKEGVARRILSKGDINSSRRH